MRISDWSSDVCSSDLSIAFDEITAAGVDRQKRARLNGLATIYAMKALPLWEIEEDVETSCPLTLKERITLGMILCGAPHFEIAERLNRSEEHTSELQSLMRISYAVFCLKKKKIKQVYTINSIEYNDTNVRL